MAEKKLFSDLFKPERDNTVGRDIKIGTTDTNIGRIDYSNKSTTVNENTGIIGQTISGPINLQHRASQDSEIGDNKIGILVIIADRQYVYNIPEGSTLNHLKERITQDKILEININDVRFKTKSKKFDKEVELTNSCKLENGSTVILYK